MQGPRRASRAAGATGSAPAVVVRAVGCPVPAEVLTVRVMTATVARAAARRGRIRRLSCMHGPFVLAAAGVRLRPFDHPGSGDARALAGWAERGVPAGGERLSRGSGQAFGKLRRSRLRAAARLLKRPVTQVTGISLAF